MLEIIGAAIAVLSAIGGLAWWSITESRQTAERAVVPLQSVVNHLDEELRQVRSDHTSDRSEMRAELIKIRELCEDMYDAIQELRKH